MIIYHLAMVKSPISAGNVPQILLNQIGREVSATHCGNNKIIYKS